MDIVQLPLGFQFTSPGPILFQLGPIAVRWYGLLIASALLIGVTLSQYLAKRRNVNPDLIGDLAIWLVIAAIPCARLYYVAFQWENYAQDPASVFAIWQGGIAIHGAILGGALAAWIFGRIHQVPFWQLADLVAPSLILGQAIGRWGNFFNSEAFGAPTNLPWKLYIPSAVQVNGETFYPRPPEYATVDYFHPTFLYESLWNLMVFALLMNLFFRDLNGKPPLKVGTLFLVYLAAYSTGRIWIEGLRTDSLMFGPLRIAQLVSLSGILLGSLGLLWLYAKQSHSLVPLELRASSSSAGSPPRGSVAPPPRPQSLSAAQTPRDVQDPEAGFAPRLVLGSLAIALFLLLAVFFTNRAALLGQTPTVSSPNPPAQVQTQPTLGQTSGSPDPVQLTSPGQTQLNRAKANLQESSASNLNQAIAQAQQILPNDPLYLQAQQDIERWSQAILDIAEGRAAQNNFAEAIAAAQLVPSRTSSYDRAQQAIAQWKTKN